MESYKCNVCDKSFTGLVCYQQHEASEKHKRKVRLTNGVTFQIPQPVNPDQFHCPVCMVSISGLDNYQKHVISLDHALNVQKKNGDLLSQSLSSTFELKTEQNQSMASAVSLTSPMNVVAPFAECKPCRKQFSGPEPYQQHLVSAGHKKKCGSSNEIMQSIETDFSIGKEKINNFLPDQQSSVFDQSTLNTSELKTEQNQLMGSPLSLTSPIQVVAPFAECKPCGKQFSGPEPYQQHLVSAGHKKKCGSSNEIMQSIETDFSMGKQKINNFLHDQHSSVFDQSTLNTSELKTEQNQLMGSPLSLTNPIQVVAPFAECKPCGKQFSGPEPYQQHLVSAGHKKKCGSSVSEAIQPFLSGADTHKMPQPFARCDICKIEFDEAMSYQMHLASDGHKKQAGDYLLGNSFGESQNAFKCDICVLKFTGPIPYQQHLMSIGHQKKINASELSKQLPTTGTSLPDSTFRDDYLGLGQCSMNDQKWYCDVCKKQCSGPIPYSSHISSHDHSKNLRILEVQENLRKVKELGPFACSGNDGMDSNLFQQITSTTNLHSELKSEIEVTSVEFKVNDLNINVKSEDTKILSDKFPINANDLLALPNLNIIPPEKLDVTVFGPDDEVVFCSPKKCKQEFLSEINEGKKVCDTEKFKSAHCYAV